jgi:transcription antitermination factor NusG
MNTRPNNALSRTLQINATHDRMAYSAEYGEPRWYAAYTCANHEKRVSDLLQQKLVEHFLPTYDTVRQRKDRQVWLRLPLFPGYIFVRVALCERLRVLQIPSVVRLVGFGGRPEPLPESEIEMIRSCLRRGQQFKRHPYLAAGRRVRVVSGPFEGLEGIVVRRKGRTRLVVSLHLIRQSVATELNIADVECVLHAKEYARWRAAPSLASGLRNSRVSEI